jgi:hypothetical protein
METIRILLWGDETHELRPIKGGREWQLKQYSIYPVIVVIALYNGFQLERLNSSWEVAIEGYDPALLRKTMLRCHIRFRSRIVTHQHYRQPRWATDYMSKLFNALGDCTSDCSGEGLTVENLGTTKRPRIGRGGIGHGLNSVNTREISQRLA